MLGINSGISVSSGPPNRAIDASHLSMWQWLKLCPLWVKVTYGRHYPKSKREPLVSLIEIARIREHNRRCYVNLEHNMRNEAVKAILRQNGVYVGTRN